MTQWKPTYGLKHAVPTVVALENALIGMGHEVGPVLRYRMTEIVREALDRTVAHTGGDPTRQVSEPELPVRDAVADEDVPDFGYPNGTVEDHPDGSMTIYPKALVDHVAETKALAETLKAQKPQKRGRGRPRSAKGRKAKAAKNAAPEAAGEAPAA